MNRNRWALGVLSMAALLVLGCAGMDGGHDIEGVWCTQKSTWICWHFEGEKATYSQRNKTSAPDEGTFRIEANTLFIEWESTTRLWEIAEKTPSMMRILNKQNGDDYLLLKREEMPKRGEKL